jgi:hypothetical protein
MHAFSAHLRKGEIFRANPQARSPSFDYGAGRRRRLAVSNSISGISTTTHEWLTLPSPSRLKQ